MICRSGTPLAVRTIGKGERGFYEVLWRWSRVRCEVARRGRNYGKETLPRSQWQRTYLPHAKTRFPTPQIAMSFLAQRRSNTSASAVKDSDVQPLLIEESKSEDQSELPGSISATNTTLPINLVNICDEMKKFSEAENIAPIKEALSEKHSREPANKEAEAEDQTSCRSTGAFEAESAIPSDRVKLPDEEDITELKKERKKANMAEIKVNAAQGTRSGEPATVVPKDREGESHLSYELRTVMRALPSAVVVLTTTSNQPHSDKTTKRKTERAQASTSASNYTVPKFVHPGKKTHRGMTLSSFASLTLSPEPIVSFNIRSPSSSLDALCRTRQFLIHILDANQQGAQIADLFTKGNGINGDNPFVEGVANGQFKVVGESVCFSKTGVEVDIPRLRGPGVGKVLKCEVFERPPESAKAMGYGVAPPAKGLMRVGDHVLVLAKVVEVLNRDGDRVEWDDGYGLGYVHREYRHVGDAIDFMRGVSQTLEKQDLKKKRPAKEEHQHEEHRNSESKKGGAKEEELHTE